MGSTSGWPAREGAISNSAQRKENPVTRQTIQQPARTTVQANLWGGMKVEIDAVARVREGTR